MRTVRLSAFALGTLMRAQPWPVGPSRELATSREAQGQHLVAGEAVVGLQRRSIPRGESR
jgi:hypothetical protein